MPKRKIGGQVRGQQRITRYYAPASIATTAGLVARGAQQAYNQLAPAVRQKTIDWSKRARNAVRSRTATQTVTRRKKDSGSNSYTQWDTKNRKDKLSVNMSLVRQMKRILKSNEEKLIFRWNGVKSFDDNGFYWLYNNTINGNRYLPMYFFDLTSCVNATLQTGTVPTIIYPQPLTRMYAVPATGAILFDNATGVKADGVTTSDDLQIERGSYGAGSAGTDLNNILPHNKDILKWISIKLNCWGAKARSTKFTVSIVRFKDDNLQPTPFISANEKRTGFFQSLAKPISFNPVSTTGSDMRKYFKVLRSETFMIQPTSTTETDQDPHVRTLKWFCRFNRLIDYVQREQSLPTAGDVADQADYAQNIGSQNASYTESTKRLYLMISATNFGKDGVDNATPTNTDTPSFDLSVRMCHTSFS